MPQERILIADDDPLIAEDLHNRLQILDYRVAGAAVCGEEATVMAEHLKPDLVLMDIQMPGRMDGIEAARHLHSRRIPVVYITGYSDGPVLDRAMGTLPYGYLHKPYETPALKAAIEVGLGRYRADQTAARQLQATQRELAEVKRLSGMISICAYCKKVREGKDTWVQIETYIMKRAEVSFSHGICLDCFDRVKRQLEAAEQSDLPDGSIVIG